jgi:hypothetical protein
VAKEKHMGSTLRTLFVVTTVVGIAIGQASDTKWAGTSRNRLRIPNDGYTPKAGFVPTAEVAAQIAEAVLTPIYGNKVITAERPFHATLEKGVWIVKGTVPCPGAPAGAMCPGGNAEIWISKGNGQILYMIHSM